MLTAQADREPQQGFMPQSPQPKHTAARFKTLKQFRPAAAILGLMLAGLPAISYADTTWTGAVSQDWNNAGNWNNGLPGPANGTIFINNISVNTPTLTTSTSGGWDIYIG